MLNWFARKKAERLGSDLQEAVAAEFPKHQSVEAGVPHWVSLLVKFLVAKWPALLQLLLMILDKSMIESPDAADAAQNIRKLQRYIRESPATVANTLQRQYAENRL
jgi:hypothetical protein